MSVLYQVCFIASAVCLGLAIVLSFGIYVGTGSSTYLVKTLKVGGAIVLGVITGLLLLWAVAQGIASPY